MSKYNTKNSYKYLGLLNFEGDVFRAYKESEDKFVIIDDNHEVILTTDENGVHDVLSGKILLTTSGGRTYKISDEHENARPKQVAIDKFFFIHKSHMLFLFRFILSNNNWSISAITSIIFFIPYYFINLIFLKYHSSLKTFQ